MRYMQMSLLTSKSLKGELTPKFLVRAALVVSFSSYIYIIISSDFKTKESRSFMHLLAIILFK